MVSRRNPLRDQVAIVGIGAAPYARDAKRTLLSLGLEAARNAIADAGIDKTQIDGICGSGTSPMETHNAGFGSVLGALGIPKATWVMNGWIGSCFVYAAEAVFSGLADYVLIVQAEARGAAFSRSALNDPFRARTAKVKGTRLYPIGTYAETWIHSGEPYAAWLNKYLTDYGATRETVGKIAINNRQWASKNPAAVMRQPITMDDYLSARMIWGPTFGVLDMDLPVDAAEAIVLTTAERARDLKNKPVYVHAMSLGGTRAGEYYENGLGWDKTCPWVAMEGLWGRTELRPADMDLFYPYDGYTATALSHLEAAGFCDVGGAKDLFEDSWDKEENILKLNGHTRVSTNGGSLSHGRLSGFNYYTEAATQLRGAAEPERQVAGAKTALCSIGSFYHDPAAVILRTEA
jgi:acetyl-CoA acetyltransferase